MNLKIKTLIGILIAGIFLIGGWWIWKNQHIPTQPSKSITQSELKISVDGKLETITDIYLPIDKIEAEKIVKKFCEPKNPNYDYGYNGIKKVNNEWRIPIYNLNCPCYAVVNIESGETNCMKEIPFETQEVTIATDKTEYKQGEIVKIYIKNNLNNPIEYYLGDIMCSLQVFSNGNWKYLKYCERKEKSKLKANDQFNYTWKAFVNPGKYRIALYYKEAKILNTKINTKEWGEVFCEDIPNELKELLINGKWIKNDVEPCKMCMACGCSCTTENLWSINGVLIDETEISCVGFIYKVKYKNNIFICSSNRFLSYPPNIIYSNEFTIKEKTELPSEWKTYKNEEYGFEIKYPKESQPCDWKDETTVFCKKLSLLSKEKEKEYYEKYKDKVLRDIYEIRYGIDILEKAEDLPLDHLQGRKKFNGVEFDFYVDWDGGLTFWAPTYYYVTEAKKQNKKIVIWIHSFSRVKGYQPPERKEMEETEQKIINQMLSTFKFFE